MITLVQFYFEVGTGFLLSVKNEEGFGKRSRSLSFDHQLQIVRSSKRMKFLIVFVAFFGLALGSDLFVGSWKEDQYKREGLGDYIYERGNFRIKLRYLNTRALSSAMPW